MGTDIKLWTEKKVSRQPKMMSFTFFWSLRPFAQGLVKQQSGKRAQPVHNGATASSEYRLDEQDGLGPCLRVIVQNLHIH